MEPQSPAPAPTNQPDNGVGAASEPVAPASATTQVEAPSFTAAQAAPGADASSWYIRNPFTVALSGISAMKKLARGMFILLLVLGILSFLGNFSSSMRDTSVGPQEQSTLYDDAGFKEPADSELNFGSPQGADASAGVFTAGYLVGVLLMVALFVAIGVVVAGMMGYTGAQLARGEGTSLKNAFQVSLKNFGRVFLVLLSILVRLLGWTLLFVIPGLIMEVRYSLSMVVAFAEPQLSPWQVVSRSASLTKGAWFDTLGARGWFSLVTLGIADMLTDVASSSVMYRQLRRLKESGQAKPSTHILNYLLPVLAVIFILLAVVALLFLMFVVYSAVGNGAAQSQTPSSFY